MSIFNIRVYGLLINERNEVLVTDEFRFGKEMTKFPGGGLIWGEGTLDCLRREFREELGCEIDVESHLYTTDYFQPSAFHPDHQLISIYYIVKSTTPFNTPVSEKKNDFDRKEDAQSFRWVPISKLDENDFTFPIDKKAAALLRATFQSPGK
jgi:8-oxo-dGTP diphosphatase